MLSFGGSNGDSMWIKNYFAAGNGSKVENIVFADGTAWTETDILARVIAPQNLPGSPGNDTYTVTSGQDAINELPGDGIDAIQEQSTDPANLDTLILGPGITPGQVGVYRVVTNNGADLDLALSFGNGDGVWIKNYFTATGDLNVDGTGNDADNVLFGLEGADTLIGYGDDLESNVTYRWLTQRIQRQHGIMKLAA